MIPSTRLYFERSADQMSEIQKALSKSQMQLGSGERVMEPSDDPRGNIDISRLQTSIRRIDSYQDTIQTLDIRLAAQDTALSSISDLMIRVKEIAVLSRNDTYNADDRKIFATEVRELVAELGEIANVQDQSGNFVFGGTRVAEPPYQADNSGVYRYVGDRSEVSVPISPTRSLMSHQGGQDIFGSVIREPQNPAETPYRVGAFDALNDFVDALETNDRDNIERAIDEVSVIIDEVVLTVSDVGSRRNTLSTQQSINEETKLRLETTLSDVKDVDYAQKVTEMQTQMMLLQAAQSSFSQISQLSLWNYLD